MVDDRVAATTVKSLEEAINRRYAFCMLAAIEGPVKSRYKELDNERSVTVSNAAEVFQVPLFGMINTVQEKVYKARGIPFVAEFYVDLDYAGDGRLIITREHEAKDPATAAKRTLRAIEEGMVTTVDGNDIPVGSESVCVHSDTPGAVDVARAVFETIQPHLNRKAA